MDNKTEIANQWDTSSTAEGSKKEIVPPYASLGDRMLAQAVDGLIASGIFFLIGMALAERFGGLTEKGFELTGFPALILMGILIVIILPYFILAEAFFGMTLGKVVAGIQVTTKEGQRISMRASIIRNLMRLIDGIVFYLIGAFSVIVTKQSQRLGDLAASTIVTTRETGRALRACALVAALALGVGGAWGGFALRGSQQTGITAGAPITATLAEATIRGSVKVYSVECYVAPCPPPKAMLTVPDREPLLLTGDASKELIAQDGKHVEIVGSFDAAEPNWFEVKRFRVLPNT